MVILSSCHSARPEEYFITVAKTLHEAGVPAVIGMKTTITHDAAIHFNTGFYTALMDGQKIEAAFTAGITAIKEFEEQKRRDNPLTVFASETDIPVLMSNNPDLSIADFSDSIVETPERPKSHTFKTNYMERGFIGRRNIIREILKRVKERQPVISLKGPGGIGKSTLTSRVMADLMREGYDFIEFQGRIEPSGIIDGLVKKAESAGEEYKNTEEIIAKTQELPEKVRLLVELYLSKEKIVIVFDNFEDNQNEKDKTYLNPEMRDFLKELKSNLQNRESFLFFTTRYELPGLATDPVNVPEFTAFETKKRFYYGEALSRLDEVSTKLIEDTVAKNPRAIDLLNILLNQRLKKVTITSDKVERYTGKLKEILESGKHPEDKDFSPFILEDLLTCLTQKQMNFLKAVAIYRKPVEEVALKKQNIKIEEDTTEYLDSLSLVEWIQIETISYYYVHRLTATFLETHFEAEEKKKLHRKAAEYFANIRDENKRYIENDIEAEYHFKKAEQYNKAFEIMGPVQSYLHTNGFTFEALNMVEEFLNYALTDKNRSNLAHSYGILLQSLGRYGDALEKYEESLQIKKRIGDVSGEGKSLHQIGNINYYTGSYDQALEKYKEALEISKRIGDVSGEAASLHQIGMIYQENGLYDDPLEKYEEALEIAKRIGDVSGEAASLHQIGMIYEEKGLYDDALEKYEKALEIVKRIGDVSGEAKSLHQFGIISQKTGSYDNALEKYKEALEIAKRIGDVSQESTSLHQIGMIYELRGSYDDALEKYEEALEIAKRIGDVSGEAKSLYQIGMIYKAKGLYDAALEQYDEISLKTISRPPRVFISYSWDSPEHKKWVAQLANWLQENGIDAILDQWDFMPGDSLATFVEQNVQNSDVVLAIISNRYINESSNIQGGEGYEKPLLAYELFSQTEKNIIPCLREKHSEKKLSAFLRGKAYIDFTEDEYFNDKLPQLLRVIFDSPTLKKPSFGIIPKFKEFLHRKKLFISYSHHDTIWLERFHTMLKPAVKNTDLSIWDDTCIKAGSKWQDEISNALHNAKVALLLVSPYFLASDFISEHELPPILDAEKEEGLIVIWVPVSSSFYSLTDISKYQAAYNPAQPLDNLSKAKRNKAIFQISEQILEHFNR